MGNICGSKEPSYGKRINDIYKDAIEHGETSKNLLSTLTLRAVTYPDQLPSIGSTLELKIKGDFSKNNELYVLLEIIRRQHYLFHDDDWNYLE